MKKLPFVSPFKPQNPKVVSVQDGYDLWSEIYDEEDNVLILLEERFLLPKIAAGSYKSIFDCGCGTGRMSMWLQRQFPQAEVTAVDFSAGMLEKARRKDSAGYINWQVADLDRPFPFADGSFDLICSTLVVEHIKDLHNYFSEMRRVAADNADIFVTGLHPTMHLFEISARFKHHESQSDIMPESLCHDISTIFNQAVDAGLKVVRIEEHCVDEHLIEQAAKAARYEGLPLLLLLQIRP